MGVRLKSKMPLSWASADVGGFVREGRRRLNEVELPVRVTDPTSAVERVCWCYSIWR
jgi:hypothetical protein